MITQFDEDGFYDIYGGWHIPFWQTKSFLLCVGVVTIIFIALIAWLIVKKIRSHTRVPAWAIALEKLKVLGDQACSSKEEGKQAYFNLTDILKKYISARYSIPITSKTDEELILFLDKQEIPQKVKDIMQQIGEGCLLIKFADQQAMQEQIDKDVLGAIDLVVTTKNQ